VGLQGYLPLSSSVDVAAAAIRLVVAEGSYFLRPRNGDPDAAAPILLDRAPVAVAPDMATFTLRERAVLELLGRGLPNKIIAYELNMSLGTVKVHVHNIISKFKVRNRTGAAVAACSMQLGRPTPAFVAEGAAKPMIGAVAAASAELYEHGKLGGVSRSA
jgi:DNA-binding NarL/FixJ family response regulator